ncbi:MAG TPA: PQQ-binding-like beta-propeller repeat protein [Planctomycetaceae bacterium]|nr:PQQ-binding-like beta-propeller repeat protein [Planctomycetaceae bacterium]
MFAEPRPAWAQAGDWAGVLPAEFAAERGGGRVGIIGTIIDVPPDRPPARAPRQPVEFQVRVQFAQPLGEPAAPAESGVLVRADRRLVQALRHAEDLVAKQNYLDACRQLQAILEAPQDGFFHPDPEQDELYRSLKAETLRIIGSLPPEGREAYRNQHAPAADALLAAAVRSDDFNALAEVARLYFHTPAGHEAVYRLGLHQLDRNEPLAGALSFERLRKIPEAAARWEPWLSLRTALCWYRTGTPASSREVLIDLASKYDPAALRTGGEPLPAFDAAGSTEEWLAKAFGEPGDVSRPSGSDWTIFRSDPSRSAVVAAGGADAEIEPWESDTVIPIAEAFEPTDSRLHDALREAVDAQRRGYDNRQRPVLPRLSPLIVGGRVVARTPGSVVSLDARTGERLQEMLEDEGYWVLMEQWENGGLANAAGVLSQLVSQRIWTDATYGSLSSDGRLVFAVEESGVAGMPPVPSVHSGLAARNSNVLRAYDAQTAKIVWECGGPLDKFALPMAGTYFLSAPLPLAGRLFAIAEQNGEVRLVVLRPADGSLDWEQPLAGTSLPSLADAQRRTTGVSPSYADGVLICPTGAGGVVALDLLTRSLLWAYRTGADEGPQAVGVPIRRGRRGNVLVRAARPSGWLDDVAVLARRHVLLTPGDSDELHCLDLFDGSLKWKQPRGEALYVAGVVDDKVLLVGPDRVSTVRLDDGIRAWDEPTRLSDGNQATVSGRGFVHAGQLHLPLSTAEIIAIDVASGSIAGRMATPDGHVPGNLVSAGGLVVSQNSERVAVFPLPRSPHDTGMVE